MIGENRYWLRLALIAVVVAGTGLAILGLGYSGHAAILGTVLAAALLFVPTLLAWEGVQRERRPDTFLDRP